jgi:regulator of cell morphogenesis and NO signaling
MQLNGAKTVREVAIEVPGATRVFEKFGVDYCCGGDRPLAEACEMAGITMEEVASSFEQYETLSQAQLNAQDWRVESLSQLVTHIVNKHHRFTREELDGIEPLLAKVCSVYGERRPELLRIKALFADLKHELDLHMMKEENVLFPFIRQMETATISGLPAPVPMFGTVRNPVRMMMTEHDGAGEVLRTFRQLSNDYNLPPDACASYQSLYSRLEALEQDLHQHIHLENNILFPRAIEIEESR